MAKTHMRRAARLFAAALLLLSQSAYLRSIDALPQQITLTRDAVVRLQLPYGVSIAQQPMPVNVSQDETLSAQLTARCMGDAHTSFSLFGVLPIKPLHVSVVGERTLCMGGQIVGIALLTDGALVVGTAKVLDASGVWRDPAQEAGLCAGDLVTHIGGEKVQNAAFMSEWLENAGPQGVQLALVRDEKEMTLTAHPVQEAGSGAYRLGVWVRDSTAGIGTLTYRDLSRGAYGALGHGILDADTKKYLTVAQGRIVQADVTEVIRGAIGTPGQISGSYSIDQASVGDILTNNEFGVFGHLTDAQTQQEVLPIAYRSQVRTGAAKIVSAVSGQLAYYDCIIEKITPQRSAQAKSIVLRVTDERLLSLTGGIVQGMPVSYNRDNTENALKSRFFGVCPYFH